VHGDAGRCLDALGLAQRVGRQVGQDDQVLRDVEITLHLTGIGRTDIDERLRSTTTAG
jgi:hypothetical protein